MSQLLTHSRMDSFRRCRRRCWFEYECRLRPIHDAKALRMGTAGHAGLDVLKAGGELEDAIAAVRGLYLEIPDHAEPLEWAYETETVAALVSGWSWRWQDQPLTILATEQTFQVPLRNPATGAASTAWMLAGKIDGIVETEDGRKAILEHKFLSEDLNADSDWWRRLQMDSQVSIYVLAARAQGIDAATVFYDVIRKPAIRPEAVPLRDADGFKIVLDSSGTRVLTKDGKKPRETGDASLGYVLQTRPMTSEEWSEKLINDIADRPDWYYARREIPRLDQDLAECQQELWAIQKTLREAQLSGQWFRTVSRDTCPYCPYFGFCQSKFDPKTAMVPEGFTYLEDPHPELQITPTTTSTEN